jgi:hypothetical protein
MAAIDPLTKLSILYNTGLHPESKHSYTPYYYNLLKDKRRSMRKILEIGVGDGRGLRMWRDFFANAKIYGAEKNSGLLFKEDRIEVFQCDPSSRSSLADLLKKTGTNIDLVIDAGTNKPDDQVFACNVLMPQLNKNVTYVIQNVADMNIVQKLAGFDVTVPKLERWRRRYDDWLVIAKNAKA